MANRSQNSGDPSLCANNCGFFGNPVTNNLCSKCYKDFLMKQSKDEKRDDDELGPEMVHGGSCSSESSEPGPGPATRCSLCKKRVGLTGFRCRCGQTFCSSHRYSDKHDCVFDYKGAGQDAIARANPVVKADKVDKI